MKLGLRLDRNPNREPQTVAGYSYSGLYQVTGWGAGKNIPLHATRRLENPISIPLALMRCGLDLNYLRMKACCWRISTRRFDFRKSSICLRLEFLNTLDVARSVILEAGLPRGDY